MQSNDLISRAAVLDAIDHERNLLIEQKRFGAEHVVVHHARRLIEEFPAVDAAPVVHGRWVDRKYGDQKECSECGEVCCCQGDYCMKCGAKMETEISNITKKKFAPSLDDAIKEFNAKWTISGAKMDGGKDDE